jgi:hypothetical protein
MMLEWFRKFNIFRLEISRRTDILALAAFMISLGGITYQFYIFFEGADVKLFPPQKVSLSAYSLPNSAAGEIVVVNSAMSYVNRGRIGHNAIIKSESVTFKIGEEEYEQKWLNFESWDLKDSKLERKQKGDAYPVPVNAGSGESHSTSFSPVRMREANGNGRWKNFLPWDDFLEEIKGSNKIEFEFEAEIYDEPTVRVTCWIELDDHFRGHLARNRWGQTECIT